MTARPRPVRPRWRCALPLSLFAALLSLWAPAPAATATTGSATSAVMVQVDPTAISRESVADALKVTVVHAVLPSRGIYLVRPATASTGRLASQLDLSRLVSDLRRDARVTRAEITDAADLGVNRFHGWPNGLPQGVDSDATEFQQQGALSATALSCARQRSATAGVRTRVTVLDTGADLAHPALGGKVRAGYNYVDDNADVADVAADGTLLDTDGDGTPNAAAGHGTFIAGLIHQLAPDAEITVSKVLDSDGYGNYYAVAQAVRDATAAGTDIISMSLSTLGRPDSEVLEDAVERAQSRGVLVVAAVGNTGSALTRKYPAADDKVLSVGALRRSTSATAKPKLTTFSDWGTWVEVAAPGEALRGPLPGDAYGTWTGTSMSTGLVAGQAAALFATKPGLKGTDLYSAITRSAGSVSGTILGSGAVNLKASVARLVSC